MRKIICIATMLFVLLSCMSMAGAKDPASSVGIVLIGNAEFKTPDYYNIAKAEIHPRSGAKCEIGSQVQSQYAAYWLNKGHVEEQTPSKQDLIDFAAESGYGKVLFLVVSDSTIDVHRNAKSKEKDRISVQVNGYLATSTSVLQIYTAAHHEDSRTSNLRARRGAFRKCVDEIGEAMNSGM